MTGGGLSKLERVGLLFELAFGFLFLPMVVATMDTPPLWLGGRFVLWFALIFLIWRLPSDHRSRLFQRVRPRAGLPGGWVGPIALFLLSLALLAQAWQMLEVWDPPSTIAAGGLPAAMLLALVGTLFAVLPLELLFRAYFPARFSPLVGHRMVAFAILAGFFFAWLHLPSLDPLVLAGAFTLGTLLALMERSGWPFWATLGFHGLAVWTWLMAPRLFLEVLPWTV